MKKQVLFSLALAGAMTLAACGSGTSSQNAAQTAENQSAPAAETMDVDSLLAVAETLVDQPIRVEGICTHTCAHGGTKIFLMGSDDTKTIRVEAGEKIGSFPQEVVNNIVTINGILREQRIDEAYLLQWEELARTQAEHKHGDAGAGCDSEQKARGEATGNVSTADRIAAFRQRIAQRKAAENKDYLSFYYIDAVSFNY
ncbi:MAG: hypothetical protein K2K83_03210 [Rikenella sp.]|nr:hypothetical protein [Rikenella sp.]